RVLQVVCERLELPWEQKDWRMVSTRQQQEDLGFFLQSDRHRGFHLNAPPLMRLVLIQLAERKFRLIWSIHHVLGDGWCTSLLLKEVLHTYDALAEGKEIELSQPRPYRDYIGWLQRQDLGKAERFWRQQLQGYVEPVRIGGEELGGGEGQEVRYGKKYAWLEREVNERLRRTARGNWLTVNTM